MDKASERLNTEALESIFRTSKKTIQEYVAQIELHCRFKSSYRHLSNGTVLDDRGRLIDLYDACIEQDAHLRGVIETLMSQILGERYMLAKQTDKGRYIKDVEQTRKIQGTQFVKIIRGIVESKMYGFTGLEILNDIDSRTGKLKTVNIIERRNILADQHRIVKRQGIWIPGWSFEDPMYADNYVLINDGTLGLFSATTPIILAKKFTMANFVNFSHTYGQPIIHGKTASDNAMDRKRLASEIAAAAQQKVLVTGTDDSVDVKTFTMSNSEHIFTGLIALVDKDVSNLILGSESMAGATQSYVGSTKAHENIFRDRVEMYRDYIELVMNESIIPRLVKMGYLESGLEFKYAKKIEMSDEDRIRLFQTLGTTWEMDPSVIESEFGITVKRQLNAVFMEGNGDDGVAGENVPDGEAGYDKRAATHMSEQEYQRRYGRARGVSNFLRERK